MIWNNFSNILKFLKLSFYIMYLQTIFMTDFNNFVSGDFNFS